VYWGGGKDKNGNCDIVYRTTVISQSKTIARGSIMPLCSGHEPPTPKMLALGDTIISLTAAGKPAQMIIQVEITDRVNGEVLNVSAPIEVIAQ